MTNLPADIRCADIETIFKKHGEVEEIRIVWKKEEELEVAVRYAEEKEAAEAQENLDEFLLDDKKVKIELL